MYKLRVGDSVTTFVRFDVGIVVGIEKSDVTVLWSDGTECTTMYYNLDVYQEVV